MTTPLRVANAPCSWGVLEFEGQGDALPYTQVLDEMAAAGYEGTEFGDWGFLPTDPVALSDAVAARGLTLLAAFVPVAFADVAAHAPGRAKALKVARLLAAAAGTTPFIVLADDNGTVPARTTRAGRITEADGLSTGGWATFARGVELVAGAVADETGLRTVFHPHCAGYVEAPWEVDRLLDATDPARVGLCYDTGHLVFGGADPLAVLARHGDRVWHVHFKDCHPQVAAQSRGDAWDYFAAVRHGVFCELGRGAVDFAAVVAALECSGYEGWIVVEQDVLPGLGTPAQSASRNRDFLRSLGL